MKRYPHRGISSQTILSLRASIHQPEPERERVCVWCTVVYTVMCCTGAGAVPVRALLCDVVLIHRWRNSSSSRGRAVRSSLSRTPCRAQPPTTKRSPLPNRTSSPTVNLALWCLALPSQHLPQAQSLSEVQLQMQEISQASPARPCTCTLHPVPCTLHPAPCIGHPAQCTLCPALCTLHPTPYTMHPAPCTMHPVPCTLDQNYD